MTLRSSDLQSDSDRPAETDPNGCEKHVLVDAVSFFCILTRSRLIAESIDLLYLREGTN